MRAVSDLAIDLALVLVFSVIGRASHGSELTLAGVAQTAWPFVVAAIAGSLLGSRLGGGSWWRSGLVAWAITLAGGVGLRLLGGDTARGGFIVVTAIVLAVFLIGWRGVAAVARRRTPAAS